MKTYRLILILFPLILSCSDINQTLEEENNKQRSELINKSLRKIYLLESKVKWEIAMHRYFVVNGKEFDYGSNEEDFNQTLNNIDIDISVLRAGITRLPLFMTDITEELLLSFLNSHDDFFVQVHSAVTLAYIGNRTGVDLLRNCAEGKIVLSTSNYERDYSALGLLLLNEELPDDYINYFWADEYYTMLN